MYSSRAGLLIYSDCVTLTNDRVGNIENSVDDDCWGTSFSWKPSMKYSLYAKKYFRQKVLAAIWTSLMAFNVGADTVLEEIIVTAQKRAESLTEVPLSISAMSGEDLASQGIITTMDLQLTTPGLTIAHTAGGSRTYIRGVGTILSGPGQENSVATYIDGVYLPAALAGLQEFGTLIERVEVLKGPQGTLYGRNATGGAINIFVKSPGDEREGNLELSMGNLGSVDASVYYSTPLTDSVSLLVGAKLRERDGYVENLVTGEELESRDTLQAFGKLAIRPNDDLSVVISGSFFKADDTIAAGYSTVEGLSLPQGAAIPGARFTTEPYKTFLNYDRGIRDHETFALSATVDYALSDSMDFRSVTSYGENDYISGVDLDATDVTIAHFVSDDQFQTTFTQEFQLLGETESTQWIVGLFYFDDEVGYGDEGPGLTVPIPPFAPSPLAGLDLVITGTQDTLAYAAFGELTYNLIGNWSVTGGLRYSYEEKEGTNLTLGAIQLGVLANYPEVEVDWDEITYKAVLKYSADLYTAYLKFETGFKSGQLNLTAPAPATVGPIDPEEIESWELGIKSDALLDGRVRLSAAAYYYDYTNLQIQGVDPSGATPTAFIESADAAEVTGVEASVTAAVTDNLTVTAAANFMSAEYDEYDPLTAFIPVAFGNASMPAGSLAGNNLSLAPDMTFSLVVNHDIHLESGVISNTLNYYHTDDVPFENTNRVVQDAFDIVNLNMRYTPTVGGWYISLWGKNLTDEEYLQFVTVGTAGDNALWAEPRTYGITLGYNLD